MAIPHKLDDLHGKLDGDDLVQEVGHRIEQRHKRCDEHAHPDDREAEGEVLAVSEVSPQQTFVGTKGE